MVKDELWGEGINFEGRLSPEKIIKWKEITEWITDEEAEKLDPVLRAFCWENFSKRRDNKGFNSTTALKLLNNELREFTITKMDSADLVRVKALLHNPVENSIQELKDFLIDQDIYLKPFTDDELKNQNLK